jgi:ectoine hydroxylase-related dioxygenase (phytanoyl-CoA dioxygenase family)
MLSAEDLDAYRRDGFVVARGVIARDEIDALFVEWRRLWDEASADLDRPGIHWRRHDTLGRIADRLDPVSILSPTFAALADDERLASIAAQALGAPCTFFKDKLITKPPGTHGYALHHDYAYWSPFGIGADDVVSISLALDANDEVNGGIEVFPGLHTRELRADRDDPLDLDPSAVEGAISHVPRLDPGDALVFHACIPHRSAPNRSTRLRRIYAATYMNARHAGLVSSYDAEKRRIAHRALMRENV